MKDMSPVGASASASKREAGLRGTETLTSVSIEPSENGGFSVRQSYRLDPPKGSRDPYPTYVEPKTFTFESFDAMVEHLKSALGS